MYNIQYKMKNNNRNYLLTSTHAVAVLQALSLSRISVVVLV